MYLTRSLLHRSRIGLRRVGVRVPVVLMPVVLLLVTGPRARTAAAQAPPPLTELPATQCQTLLGTPGFHCYQSPDGWVVAKTRAHADMAARDIARENADFHRYFAAAPPRFAVVVDTNRVSADEMARFRAMGADGALPWPIDPVFERLGVMNHELGHLYYFVAFPGPGAPWMKEVSAILMERPVTTRSRYRKLSGILRSPQRDQLLVPLATLFTMAHPGHGEEGDETLGVKGGITISGSLGPDTGKAASDTGALPPDRVLPPPPPPAEGYRPGTVFYAECRSVIDFLIEQSHDSTIFRAITEQAGRGKAMGPWLQQSGSQYHLPTSIAALDRAWRAWLLRRGNIDARAGYAVSPDPRG